MDEGYTLSRERIKDIINVMFSIIVVLFIVFAIGQHNNRNIDVKVLEGEVILNRLFYSEDCLAYNDGYRTHPGIIDASKFDDERIKKCLNGDYYAKAELVESKKETYNERELYEKDVGFCKFENKFYCYDKSIYVIVRDGNEERSDIMKLSFVLPLFLHENE